MAPGHGQKTRWIKGLRSLCVSSRDFRLDGEKNISTSRLKKRIAYYDWGQRPCSLTSFARTSCGHTSLPMRNKASHQWWFSNEPFTTRPGEP